jgi:hypothetical protein
MQSTANYRYFKGDVNRHGAFAGPAAVVGTLVSRKTFPGLNPAKTANYTRRSAFCGDFAATVGRPVS